MDMSLGVGLLAATTLLFWWAYGAHRRPDRAGWVAWPGVSMLICVAFTMSGPVGLGFVVRGLMDPMADLAKTDFVLAGGAIALAVIALLASPLLIRPALRGQVEAHRAVNVNAAPLSDELPRAA